MKRVLALVLLLGSLAGAQTPDELAQTARFLAGLQNPDGGFAGAPGGPSSLGSTSSVVRTLKNVGGSIPDVGRCIAYVQSCYDLNTGAFAPTPGGTPTVAVTASGLMVAAELKIANPAMIERAIKYFSEHAKSFEEVRIALAGLEAVRAKSPDFPAWTKQIVADRNPDGTWGQGGGQARATGSAAAALLRMGVELEHKDAVVQALKDGQRPDGGWSRDGGDSDLETTYRVMRALFMLKAPPDLDRLRAYLARHRRPNGAYAGKVGGQDNGGNYFVTTVNRWARLLAGEPAIVETAGFVPLFDGKSLDGWEGDTALWSARDGMLVGTSPGLDHNDFLATKSSYGDFILQFSFRLVGGRGNSGVQFRSVRAAGREMSGYQADIGENFWGCLYDESRRNRVLAQASDRAAAAVRRDGWNHYVIRALGNHIRLTLNGVTSVDYREADDDIARDGRIALQIHSGGPMEVQFKDIYIQPLPTPTTAADAQPGFHLRTLKTPDGERRYTVYLPEGHDGGEKLPVVLFLHGAGERGRDGVLPAQVGLGPQVLRRPGDYRFIGVFPRPARPGGPAPTTPGPPSPRSTTRWQPTRPTRTV